MAGSLGALSPGSSPGIGDSVATEDSSGGWFWWTSRGRRQIGLDRAMRTGGGNREGARKCFLEDRVEDRTAMY